MTTMRESTLSLTIEVASLKGGGGKSNITTNLAVAFKALGYTVAIVDADRRMNTTEQWHDDRVEYIDQHPNSGVELIPVVKKTGKLGATINELSSSYNIVIVDTGAQDSAEVRSALGFVDVAVTPVEPAQEALDGIEPFIEIVEGAQEFNEDLMLVAVLSRVPPNAPKRVAEARGYLQYFVENNGLSVAQTPITNRVAHPDSKANGLSVMESKDATARAEVEALAAELLTITKGK